MILQINKLRDLLSKKNIALIAGSTDGWTQSKKFIEMMREGGQVYFHFYVCYLLWAINEY